MPADYSFRFRRTGIRRVDTFCHLANERVRQNITGVTTNKLLILTLPYSFTIYRIVRTISQFIHGFYITVSVISQFLCYNISTGSQFNII